MGKGDLDIDPRGLIYESYRIEGISAAECRSIFLDWAMGQPVETDMPTMLRILKAEYGNAHPDHPMTGIIDEGLSRRSIQPPRRTRRRRK